MRLRCVTHWTSLHARIWPQGVAMWRGMSFKYDPLKDPTQLPNSQGPTCNNKPHKYDPLENNAKHTQNYGKIHHFFHGNTTVISTGAWLQNRKIKDPPFLRKLTSFRLGQHRVGGQLSKSLLGFLFARYVGACTNHAQHWLCWIYRHTYTDTGNIHIHIHIHIIIHVYYNIYIYIYHSYSMHIDMIYYIILYIYIYIL